MNDTSFLVFPKIPILWSHLVKLSAIPFTIVLTFVSLDTWKSIMYTSTLVNASIYDALWLEIPLGYTWMTNLFVEKLYYKTYACYDTSPIYCHENHLDPFNSRTCEKRRNKKINPRKMCNMSSQFYLPAWTCYAVL